MIAEIGNICPFDKSNDETSDVGLKPEHLSITIDQSVQAF